MSCNRYFVSGRVHGVGYRYFAAKAAQALGVRGFCRNRPDGRVEVVAEADDGVLEKFEQELSRGPSFASVDGLEKERLAARGDEGFEIR